MDIEIARYIITWYSSLLTLEEAAALKHKDSIFKLLTAADMESTEAYEARKQLLQKQGWVSGNPKVLSMVEKENDRMIIEMATDVLARSGDKVYFNRCPKCGSLARTPKAKQCRACFHSWHSS